MGVKLVSVLTISVISKDNCVFRNLPRARVEVLRQAVLLSIVVIFLAGQAIARPFIGASARDRSWR